MNIFTFNIFGESSVLVYMFECRFVYLCNVLWFSSQSPYNYELTIRFPHYVFFPPPQASRARRTVGMVGTVGLAFAPTVSSPTPLPWMRPTR
jgi:hypothetical protein